MANKQSIQDVDEALDLWHRRLNMCVTKINELRDKRKRLIQGLHQASAAEGCESNAVEGHACRL